MAKNTDVKSISLPSDYWKHIDNRVINLRLPERTGRSDYFRMLVELDSIYEFTKHPHAEDGRWHLYPEFPASLIPLIKLREEQRTEHRKRLARHAAQTGYPNRVAEDPSVNESGSLDTLADAEQKKRKKKGE